MNKSCPFLGVVLLFLFFFPACASDPIRVPAELSMREQWDSGHFVSEAQDGMLIVIGVASRQADRWGNDVSPAEITLAKDDAARKIAMFHGTGGTVESRHRQGVSFFDFIAESTIQLEHAVADHAQFIDQLTFDLERDVFVHNGGTLVRFRFPSAGLTRTNFVGAIDASGRPSWVGRHDFNVEGYIMAVGFSQNQVWLRDTVMRATEATAARLIKGIDTYINERIVEVEGVGTFTYIESISRGTLNGFRIIEFWIDPDTMSVYSLGIARRAE